MGFIYNSASYCIARQFDSNLAGGGVLVGGQKFGTNSTLGVDKKQGLTANTDVQLGKNQTLHGGLGKENTFINDLTKLTENSKKNKPATRRGNGGQHK